MKICKVANCGYTTDNDNETFCPDDGNPLFAGNSAAGQAAAVAAPVPLPVAEPEPFAFPDVDTQVKDTRLVIKTLVLPYPDKTGKKEKDMREGDTFSAAREGTAHDVDMIVPADKDGSVSGSDPFILTVRNGQLVAKGGGVNGYKTSYVQAYEAGVESVLGDLPTKATMTIVLGAKTPIRVK